MSEILPHQLQATKTRHHRLMYSKLFSVSTEFLEPFFPRLLSVVVRNVFVAWLSQDYKTRSIFGSEVHVSATKPFDTNDVEMSGKQTKRFLIFS